jgi:hypothetical protein
MDSVPMLLAFADKHPLLAGFAVVSVAAVAIVAILAYSAAATDTLPSLFQVFHRK